MTETLLEPTELDRVRAEVVPLLELDEDDFPAAGQAFLDQRVAELTVTSTIPEQLDATQGNTQGFIPPETMIFPWVLGKGYKLDDPELYATTMPVMRQYYKDFLPRIGDPEKAYRNAALFTAQLVQQTYFGSVHTGAAGRAQRELLTGDFIEDEGAPEVRSISKFKGVAMCAERAAVANNVLQIFGMRPVLEIGKLQIDDQYPEFHAYLFVLSGNGKEKIFDPTNPTLTFDESGALLAANPAFYDAGDPSSARGSGEPLVVEHRTYERNEQGRGLRDEQAYKFFVSRVGQELHPE